MLSLGYTLQRSWRACGMLGLGYWVGVLMAFTSDHFLRQEKEKGMTLEDLSLRSWFFLKGARGIKVLSLSVVGSLFA